MTKNIINLPEVTGSAKSMVRFVESANRVLALATDNFERIRVRDAAERAQGVAAALGLREVGTKCSLIVADAERVIVQETPVKQGQRIDLLTKVDPDQPADNFAFNEGEVINPKTLRNMREAHSGLTDDQYNEVKKQAIIDSEPLSRRKIKAHGKLITKRDNPPAPKASVDREVQEEMKMPVTSDVSFQDRILQMEAEIEDRDERIAIMAESESAQAVELRFDQQKAVIKTLRSQIGEWQRKHESELRRGNAIEKVIKKQEAEIETLKDRVLELSR